MSSASITAASTSNAVVSVRPCRRISTRTSSLGRRFRGSWQASVRPLIHLDQPSSHGVHVGRRGRPSPCRRRRSCDSAGPRARRRSSQGAQRLRGGSQGGRAPATERADVLRGDSTPVAVKRCRTRALEYRANGGRKTFGFLPAVRESPGGVAGLPMLFWLGQ
jgi:hypothetical protein